MFEEKFFLRRKANDEALLRYGFTKEENGFLYETAVMDGQFRLRVSVTPQGVSTKMTDTAADEEYTLYKSDSSVGSFVGEVRSACESVLREIAEACFEADVFRTEQSLAAIRFIREKFGDELEFLWEKFPENAVWRQKTTVSGTGSSPWCRGINWGLIPRKKRKSWICAFARRTRKKPLTAKNTSPAGT